MTDVRVVTHRDCVRVLLHRNDFSDYEYLDSGDIVIVVDVRQPVIGHWLRQLFDSDKSSFCLTRLGVGWISSNDMKFVRAL